MPKIELLLPGTPRTTIEDVAEGYRITIERVDGIACTEIEARTTMSMFCIHAVQEQANAKRRIRRNLEKNGSGRDRVVKQEGGKANA